METLLLPASTHRLSLSLSAAARNCQPVGVQVLAGRFRHLFGRHRPHQGLVAVIIIQPQAIAFDIQQSRSLPAGSLTCFVCQTPVTVQFGERDEIEIQFADETIRTLPGRALDEDSTRHIFWRDGVIRRLAVSVADSER